MAALLASLRLLRSPTQRKHFLRWLRSMEKDFFLKRRQPWLVFDAVDFLDSLVLEGRRVFEYGSGGSTLYWCARRMHCVSVEHDPGWHEGVARRLEGIPSVDYRLVEPEPDGGAAGDVADPDGYRSSDERFVGHVFRRYAMQIDPFPDGSFDVVLVDGRARPSCLRHAAPKVKRGGFLILDNAERGYYTANLGPDLRDFERRSFHGAGPAIAQMWTTDFYRRIR
jgi:hypothetical protein